LSSFSRNKVKSFKKNMWRTSFKILKDGVFIHILVTFILFYSIGMCRMRRFLAVLRSFFNSSLSYTFSCHSSPPPILPSSLTSPFHLFLGLHLGLVVSKFIYNTLLGILSSSILTSYVYENKIS
jgi:hypothetical protein